MLKNLPYVWVIARRDYLASVLSRAFLIFLVAPLLPFAFGNLFSSDGNAVQKSKTEIEITLNGSADQNRSWIAARDHLSARLPSTILPILHSEPTSGRAAILTGTVLRPVLRGKVRPTPEQLLAVSLIVGEAQAIAGGRSAGKGSELKFELPDATIRGQTLEIGQIGQIGMLILTMLLSGMMLSSLVEERSTKVMDILASALPVHVIFYGKLLSILLMAVTGMTVWTVTSLWFATPALAALDVTVPAIGWTLFTMLSLIYALTAILLFGAIYLAAGAYASTARELQAVAVPLTVVQVLSFALALNGWTSTDALLRWSAFVVPLSSPFAMLGFASTHKSLAPHLAAVAWQIGCAVVVVRWSATAFRESVLNGKPLTLIKRLQALRTD